MAFVAVGVMSGAHAAPSLQIDILSETTTYDNSTDVEDVVTQNSVFEVRALGGTGTQGKPASLNTPYRLSIALTPKPNGSDPQVLGSFKFDGIEVVVTADMDFGTPPVEVFTNPDELPSHGIFDTFFIEETFQFTAADVVAINNVEDNPGQSTGACDPTTEDCLFFVDFLVDITNLDPDFELHFDLYEPELTNGVVTGVVDKAPFSHDASSNGRVPPVDPPGIPIAEPATLSLLGLGVLGVSGIVWSRRRARAR